MCYTDSAECSRVLLAGSGQNDPEEPERREIDAAGAGYDLGYVVTDNDWMAPAVVLETDEVSWADAAGSRPSVDVEGAVVAVVSLAVVNGDDARWKS